MCAASWPGRKDFRFHELDSYSTFPAGLPPGEGFFLGEKMPQSFKMIGLWCVLGLTGVASERPQEMPGLPSSTTQQQEELENVAMNAIKEFLEDPTQTSRRNEGKPVQNLERSNYNPYDDPGNWMDINRGTFTDDGVTYVMSERVFLPTYRPPEDSSSNHHNSLRD